MSRPDEQEISSVAATPNQSRFIGIAVAVGVVLLVGYFSVLKTGSQSDQKNQQATPAYSLNYAKPAGDHYPVNAGLSGSAKNHSIAALNQFEREKTEKMANQQSEKALRELHTRLRSPLVVVYDKPGLRAQYQKAVQAHLQGYDSFAQAVVLNNRLINNSTNPVTNSTTAATSMRVVKARQLTDLRYTILQGKTIAAVLETPINTQLPGMLKAVVTRPVYAERGRIALIPAGSRLIGRYNARTVQGQVRVYMIWSRLITPDFITINLNSPGADQMGRAGMAGEVNSHFWRRFANSVLLSMLGAGSLLAGVDGDDQANSMAAMRTQVAANLNLASTAQIRNAATIKPTITVPQGTRITVLVAQDLKFMPVVKPAMHQ